MHNTQLLDSQDLFIKKSTDDSLLEILKRNPITIQNNFSDEEIKEAYLILKKAIYNKNSAQWIIRKTIKTLKTLDIPLKKFIKTFETISSRYHKTNQRGIKSTQLFIDNLKKHKKDKSGKQLTHLNQKDKHLMRSLSALKEWKNEFLDISDEDFINFISKRLDFPYTSKTLRSYYYEKTSR